MNMIVIDTETGGLQAQVETHALLSIAAVTTWGAREFYVKVEPDGEINPGAAAKNGYTPEGWADALPIKIALLEFQRWLVEVGASQRKATLLAHNAGFDKTWIEHRAGRHGIELGLGHRWRCSMAAMGFMMDRGELPPGSTSLDALTALSRFDWGPGRVAHDALQDAHACLHGYQWLLAPRVSLGEIAASLNRLDQDLATLREGGNIEQDADGVGMVHRPPYYDDTGI